MNANGFSLACAAAILFVAAGAFATETEAPASLTDLPATRPVSQVQRWLEELTHPESAMREQARLQLMGLGREGLGELRETADRLRPLSPAQAAVLHDIVIHVYIGGGVGLGGSERGPVFRKSGFLGVLLEPMQSGAGIPVQPNEPIDFNHFGGGGVLIKETWPGFAGFRFLRVGDVVIGTGGAEPMRAPTLTELKAAVSSTMPGRVLELQVLRQGRVVVVPIRVTARPPWAEDELSTRQMQNRRVMRAEAYWRFAFAPLLLPEENGMS